MLFRVNISQESHTVKVFMLPLSLHYEPISSLFKAPQYLDHNGGNTAIVENYIGGDNSNNLSTVPIISSGCNIIDDNPYDPDDISITTPFLINFNCNDCGYFVNNWNEIVDSISNADYYNDLPKENHIKVELDCYTLESDLISKLLTHIPLIYNSFIPETIKIYQCDFAKDNGVKNFINILNNSLAEKLEGVKFSISFTSSGVSEINNTTSLQYTDNHYIETPRMYNISISFPNTSSLKQELVNRPITTEHITTI